VKILCVFGQHNYGNPGRGLGYEYANFIPALQNLGHEVSFFDSWDKSLYRDFSDLNRQLLHSIAEEEPDVIFCVLMGYEIWLETFDLIRSGSKAAIVNWATDDSWKYEQFSRFVAPAFDAYATTYPSAMQKAESDGYDNFTLTQWAANSAVMAEPLPADRCRYQVSFVGTAYGNRISWMEQLKASGVEVACFGYGWPNGPVAAEDIPQIMRDSIISLNFADSGVLMKGLRPVRSRQIKARVFEIPGAGGLLMTEPAEHLEQFYEPGKEDVLFRDMDELAANIQYLLAHPEERNEIARAGFERTRREHSYELRFQELLEFTLRRVKPLPKTVKDPADMESFETLARQHGHGRLLALLKYFLLLPCAALWGRKRGARAARRFLFELSWRLLGRRTYMASSLPGRLFYRES